MGAVSKTGGVVGGVIVLAASWHIGTTIWLKSVGELAVGVVVGEERLFSVIGQPVIEFQTKTGERVPFTGNVTSLNSVTRGQLVDVIYDPERPYFMVAENNIGGMWIRPIAYALIGLGIIFAPLLMEFL